VIRLISDCVYFISNYLLCICRTEKVPLKLDYSCTVASADDLCWTSFDVLWECGSEEIRYRFKDNTNLTQWTTLVMNALQACLHSIAFRAEIIFYGKQLCLFENEKEVYLTDKHTTEMFDMITNIISQWLDCVLSPRIAEVSSYINNQAIIKYPEGELDVSTGFILLYCVKFIILKLFFYMFTWYLHYLLALFKFVNIYSTFIEFDNKKRLYEL